MPNIIFLKGLPASGKTTFAKDLVKEFPNNYIRVNKDDIRLMLHDGVWSKNNEKEVLLLEWSLVIAALKNGQSVILDNTHFNPVHEKKYRDLAQEHDVGFELRFFDTDVSECIRRDRLRGKDAVGEQAIKQMWRANIWKRPEKPLHVADAPDAIIVDLDGTLANVDHRLHHVFGHKKNWEAFFSEMHADEVNGWCRTIVESASNTGIKILIVSGRPEKYRDVTESWLNAHEMERDALIMRPDTLPDGKPDYRPDDIVKEELYNKHILGQFNILYVLDDRKRVVQMWRKRGLTVLHCDEGDF